MTTLIETERQLLAVWHEYSFATAETDDEITYWADRLSPLQRQIERATPATAEDAAVILRQAARNADGNGVRKVCEQIQRVADWLDPGRGLACTDPRILRPCRFCGERQYIRVDEGGFPRVAVQNGKAAGLVWRGSQVVSGEEHVDAVYCQVCDTVAALDVWNGTRPASDYVAIRGDDEPAEAGTQGDDVRQEPMSTAETQVPERPEAGGYAKAGVSTDVTRQPSPYASAPYASAPPVDVDRYEPAEAPSQAVAA